LQIAGEKFQIIKMKNLAHLFITVILITLFNVGYGQKEIPYITDPRLDFTVIDQKGDSVKLSSLKGKVFLLDFWASWCGPCRASNKQLIKLYSKYKAKGFEIFSVSIDEQEKDWKKAIAKDKISWLLGIDTGGWDAKAALKWNVEAIPASFLIGKNGEVVAIDPDKVVLEKMVKDLLGL
jgi:thiol-disulfide isomerase/thioredoxin